MNDHVILDLIKQADQAISTEDFDVLMNFYAEDAILVVQPGQIARGKPQIRQAFEAISKHFGNQLSVLQGEAHVLEAANTALVIMETLLLVRDDQPIKRCATYVFAKSESNGWVCIIDNSYGTELLNSIGPAL